MTFHIFSIQIFPLTTPRALNGWQPVFLAWNLRLNWMWLEFCMNATQKKCCGWIWHTNSENSIEENCITKSANALQKNGTHWNFPIWTCIMVVAAIMAGESSARRCCRVYQSSWRNVMILPHKYRREREEEEQLRDSSTSSATVPVC